MQLISFGEQLNTPITLCLGYFGCMHLGHIELVRVAQRCAEQKNSKVALFTFSDDRLSISGKADKAIYTFDERLSLYESVGVDFVIVADFDEKFRNNTGTQFAEQLKMYNPTDAVCGFDYSFGRDRLTASDLKALLYDTCNVHIINAVCRNGVKISTTLIHNLLSQNKIENVNEMLSEPFFLTGTVEHGRHMGSKMGFPTANISVGAEKLLPIGVYEGIVKFGNEKYRAIVNVGQKPTFDLDCVSVEAHLLDFDGDLYGRKIKVSLTRFLRPIYKFTSESQLKNQLQSDKEKVLND